VKNYYDWLITFANGTFTKEQKMLHEIAGQMLLMQKLNERLYKEIESLKKKSS